MDKVEVKDVSSEYVIFSFIGIEGKNLIVKLGVIIFLDIIYVSYQLISLKNLEVRVVVGSGLIKEGYILIVFVNNVVEVW